jgi:GT2 family glycosyltransferase
MIRFHSLIFFAASIFLPNKWQRSTTLFADPRYAGLSTDNINRVDIVSGCFMFTRRKVLEDIGALDTRFFMYGEEAEWCFRAGQAGWDIVYNPHIEILHHGAASTGHMSEWKAIEMTRGHILFLRFTRGSFIAWVGTLLMALRDLVRLPYYAISYIARGFKASGGSKAWWARLKFELRALFSLPAGQSVSLPDPESVKR